MHTDNTELSLGDLCGLAGVTKRTVRYYIQQGLLSSPGIGRGARYTRSHLGRLRMIRALQEEHLPLAIIRQRLLELDDQQLRSLIDVPPAGAAASSKASLRASDYVKAALAESRAPNPAPLTPRPRSRPGSERSTWERVVLAPDVELHLRRPLSRPLSRRVDQLLAHAQTLFEQDPPPGEASA